jgi:hypothetical protein
MPSPYAPRSRANLEGLKAGLTDDDLAMPTPEEIEAAQGDPVQMSNLLAKAQAAQSVIDSTRGKDYLTKSGNYVVANPWGAVSDIFVRGQAAKERDEANKSAEEIGKKQRAADAYIRRKEIAQSRGDAYRKESSALDELDRGDAQSEYRENTRQKERGEDNKYKTTRDEISDAWNKSEAGRQSHQFHDELALGYARIGADGAKDKAELDKEREAKSAAYNTWTVASSQYLDAHKGAGYGPGVGGGYGMRKGARANLAPVLKGIFRSAGEGTFTDKDQALLLDMAPGDFDTDEQAATKLKNIDNIVRAKMGMSGPEKYGTSDEDILGRYAN